MDYIPKATYSDGNCAFHAIFGEFIESEYYCAVATEKRKYVADTLRDARPGTILSQKIIDALKALIMELQTAEITSENITQISQRYGQAIADLYSRYIKAVQFNWETLNLTPDLINAYATFIENPSQYLMEADIAIIAEVFEIRINYFIRGQGHQFIKCQTFIPSSIHADIREITICHDGQNHYERMVAAVSTSTNSSVQEEKKQRNGNILDNKLKIQAKEKNRAKKIFKRLRHSAAGLEVELRKFNYIYSHKNSGTKRDSRLENHTAKTKQYMNEIEAIKMELFSILSTHNESLASVTPEKNFLRMDNFYSNHTQHLETLIKTISENQIENIGKTAFALLVQNFYEMAKVHTFLNMKEKAAYCYKRAIQYLSPEYIAKLIYGIKKHNVTALESFNGMNTTKDIDFIESSNARKFFSLFTDIEKINIRVILLDELGACFADLKKYKKSYKCYKKIFNFLLRHSLWDNPDIDIESLMTDYITTVTMQGESSASLINQFKKAFPQEDHVLLILNATSLCLDRNENNLSNKYTKKMNRKATDTQLVLLKYFLRRLDYILGQVKVQAKIILQKSPLDFYQCINISEPILRDLEKTQNMLEMNLTKIKTEADGRIYQLTDSAKETIKLAIENIAIHFSNQGEKFQKNNYLHRAKKFLKYSLSLQKKYGNSTGKTLTLLGELYHSLYEKNNDIFTKNEYYKKSQEYFEDALSDSSPAVRAMAHMGKAQLCSCKREGYNFEIRHFIETLANLSYIKDKNSKLIKYKNTAIYMLNELVELVPHEFEKIESRLQEQIEESQLQEQIEMDDIKDVEYKGKCLALAQNFLHKKPLASSKISVIHRSSFFSQKKQNPDAEIEFNYSTLPGAANAS